MNVYIFQIAKISKESEQLHLQTKPIKKVKFKSQNRKQIERVQMLL